VRTLVQAQSAPVGVSCSAKARTRRLMWILLAAALISLPFLSIPGRYVFDSRDPLWLDPSAYLARVPELWWRTPWLGHQQHDGMVFPFGAVVWLFRSAGLPAWAAERLWHGILLFVSTGSTILLVDRLQGRKTIFAPLTTGLLYTLTPYTFGYGLRFSAVYIPYVLLPLLVLVTLKGAESRGLVWPILFGLTTFAMGGGNGATQVYAIAVALGLLAWLAFVREVPMGHALRFGGWSLVFLFGLNAYWLLLLRSSEVSNAVAYSEQPATINVSSSASEVMRGLGYWQYYGGDQFGPWVPPVQTYITSVPMILAGFVMPVGALLSVWLVRWRYRAFFFLLGLLALFISVGLFPTGPPTPFGRILLFLYAHVPGVAGLRTTYKATPALSLSLAVLAGIGLSALWSRVASFARAALWRGGLIALVILTVGASAFPLWTGTLYNSGRSLRAIPQYWHRALNELDRREGAYRAFFAPATSYWAIYRWGTIKEGIVASDPQLGSIYPTRGPVGLRYGSNLIAATEDTYLNGLPAPGTAQLFRYLGVRDVVLQNDVDWQRSHTARPADLQRLLGDPDIVPLTSFGHTGQNVVGRGSSEEPRSLTKLEHDLPPVEVLSVRNPEPIVRAESADPVVISGDGFGLASAARSGLLRRGTPVLYSGTLSPPDLDELLGRRDVSFVITDSNRREVWFFTRARAPHSPTLMAGETIGNRPIGYDLFNRRPGTQSVAVYHGVRAISASPGGSLFGPIPAFRAANAFDRNRSTWWITGVLTSPIGSWVEADFKQPTTLSRIAIKLPRAPRFRAIRRVRLEFSDGSSTTASVRPRGSTVVTFSPRETDYLRLRVLSVRPGSSSADTATVSDIVIPGLSPQEIVQVPNDLLNTARRTKSGLDRLAKHPLTFLFERARSGNIGEPDEEVVLRRRFDVPTRADFRLFGTVTLNRSSSDDQIDQALLGKHRVRVTSSSRLFGNPLLRGSAALDGNAETEWVPQGSRGESLTIEFPPHPIDRITVDTNVRSKHTLIQKLRAIFPDGTSAIGKLANPQRGTITIRFPKRIASKVTLKIQSVFPTSSSSYKPVGIREVHIPGVEPLKSDPKRPLPCWSKFSMDGRPISIQPNGTVDDLLRGQDVPFKACDGKALTLGRGWHDLVAGGGLQADTVRLSTPGVANTISKEASVAPPRISADPRSDGGWDIHVQDATSPYYLNIGQNFDPGWKASINGHDLGRPLLLDGYAEGWRVTARGSYTVTVRYGPQRLYNVAIAVSGLTLLIAVCVLGAQIIRRRSNRQTRT
jgi:arabinofuranan 3-O-arabinosyltransferase